jgi:hypothetical protein
MSHIRVALMTLVIFIWTDVGLVQTLSPDPALVLPSLSWIQGPNGHFYALSTVIGTWPEVEAQAVSEGGHLVTIRNKAENDFLVQTFLVGRVFCEPLPTSGPWIGLTDAQEEGVFTWVSGEPVTFTNWLESKPDDHDYRQSGKGEDYVQFFSANDISPVTGIFVGQTGGADGTWNDQSLLRLTHCGDALPGIIEVTSLQPLPFSPTTAICQQVIGQGSALLMEAVQQQYASCLNSETLGWPGCNPTNRDAAIAQTVKMVKSFLDSVCTLGAYTELRYFGDTPQTVRDRIIQNTLDTTEILIRQTYPAAYTNKP